MQTINENALKSSNLEIPSPTKKTDYSLILVCVASFITLIFIVSQMLNLLETKEVSLLSDAMQGLISLVSVILVWKLICNPLINVEIKRSWKIIFGSYIFYSIGHNIWFYYSSILGVEPFPSIADVGFWLFYPFMFWALLSFPTDKSNKSERPKFILDIATVMLGGTLAVWHFIVRPTIENTADGEWLTTTLNLFYTVGDMVLMLGIATTLLRRPLAAVKVPLFIIIFGLINIFAADIGFAYFTLQKTYTSGHWVDNLFISGMLFMAIAAYYQNYLINLATDEAKVKTENSALKFNWLPYLGIAVGFGILILETQPYWFEWTGIVVFASLIMTGLVVVRQIIAVKEYNKLLEEKTARQHELRFRAFVENSSDMLTIWDEAGRLTFISPSIKNVLGYDIQELHTKSAHTLIHPDDREKLYINHQKLIKNTHKSFTIEYRVLNKDGSYRVLEGVGQKYFDEVVNMNYVLVNARDITKRKADEHRLTAYNAKLEQSNRELQDFAYIASHDLQEPLRKVQAFGDRLDRKYGEPLGDEGRDYLSRMRGAASRMQTLINDLLSFSRVATKSLPLELTDLDKICSEVVSDLEVRIEEKKATVEIIDLPKIEADPMQMQQLFQNLIANALKFQRQDVPPIVKVYQYPIDETESKDFCKIAVEDNGIGFDEKYLDRIFTVFQRLHGRSEYEGSGVGLAVCRKIVERHNGQITAKSSENKGTTFIVTLPIKNNEGVISDE